MQYRITYTHAGRDDDQEGLRCRRRGALDVRRHDAAGPYDLSLSLYIYIYICMYMYNLPPPIRTPPYNLTSLGGGFL